MQPLTKQLAFNCTNEIVHSCVNSINKRSAVGTHVFFILADSFDDAVFLLQIAVFHLSNVRKCLRNRFL